MGWGRGGTWRGDHRLHATNRTSFCHREQKPGVIEVIAVTAEPRNDGVADHREPGALQDSAGYEVASRIVGRRPTNNYGKSRYVGQSWKLNCIGFVLACGVERWRQSWL